MTTHHHLAPLLSTSIAVPLSLSLSLSLSQYLFLRGDFLPVQRFKTYLRMVKPSQNVVNIKYMKIFIILSIIFLLFAILRCFAPLWCIYYNSKPTINPSNRRYIYTNPLALELDIYNLAHHLCKMWIFYEPRRVTYTKFCGGINEDGGRKSKK